MLKSNDPVKHLVQKLYSNPKVEFLFTKDPKQLNRYFDIRKQCYRSVAGGPADFDGTCDPLDCIADILVVRVNDKVVGGGRLIGSTPEARAMLPLEQKNFMIKDAFPHLELENKSYCEFGRIAILPEHRNFKNINELCQRLILRARDRGYCYQFSMAPMTTSRLYKRVSSNLKLDHPYVIHEDIIMPAKPVSETGGLKMYLGSLRLEPQESSENRSNIPLSGERMVA